MNCLAEKEVWPKSEKSWGSVNLWRKWMLRHLQAKSFNLLVKPKVVVKAIAYDVCYRPRLCFDRLNKRHDKVRVDWNYSFEINFIFSNWFAGNFAQRLLSKEGSACELNECLSVRVRFLLSVPQGGNKINRNFVFYFVFILRGLFAPFKVQRCFHLCSLG